VEWGPGDVLYPVNVQVEAWDRVGLMRDVTTVVAEDKVNIASANLADGDGHTINIFLTLETKGLAYLSHVLKKIEAVKGVLNVSRIGDDASRHGGADSSVPLTRGKDAGSKK